MKRAEPLVSIIIPAYNYGHYISEAVDSALAQTWSNCEIIVIDDGSTDSTREILAAYGDRIRYHYQPNSGLSAARNTGIELARGEFLQFLDADDLLGRDSIEQRLSTLAANPTAAFAVCPCRVFVDRFGRRWSWNGWPLPHEGEMDLALVYFNIAPPHAFLVRASAIHDLDFRFDTTLKACEDYDFWFRLASAQGLPAVSARGRVHYRKHAASMSRNRASQYSHDVILSEKVVAYLEDCIFARRYAANYLIALLASSLITLRRLAHTCRTDAESYLHGHIMHVVRQLDLLEAGRCDALALVKYRALIYSFVYDLLKRDALIEAGVASRIRGAVNRHIPVVPFHYSALPPSVRYARRALQASAMHLFKKLTGRQSPQGIPL